MNGLRDLPMGAWAILGGESLLVVCSVCYLVWWSIAFKPPVAAPGSGGKGFLAGAVLGGGAGLVLLLGGMLGLASRLSWPAVGAVVLGGVVVGAGLFAVTSGPLHRPVTSELPLIIIWATAQLAAGVALATAGHLTAPAASAWVVAVVVATLVGLACYVVFYRLAPVPAYWVGILPLAVDGLASVLLAWLVVAG